MLGIVTWAVLTAGWGVLSYEHAHGLRNLTPLEAGLMWMTLAVATAAAAC